MGRLERGESEKIDKINDYVFNVQNMCGEDRDKYVNILLDMFNPLILSLCNKWSKYFKDERHNIIQWDELIVDAQYWFVHYTLHKYTIDGSATYNTFIKNHMDQRIRYIYEKEIKYYNKLIFPDPNRETDEMDTFESVIYNYSSDISGDSHGIDTHIVNDNDADDRVALAHRIIDIVNSNGSFNDRERLIFNKILCNGVTHDLVSKELNISRTRVTQILKKIKIKLYKIMNNDSEVWELVISTDIDFEEM